MLQFCDFLGRSYAGFTIFYHLKNCIYFIFAASMKKILSFILIVLFVNSVLLLPQLPDSFTNNPAASDNHMGSLIELVHEILLEKKDVIPYDKEDKTLENSVEETCCHRLLQRSDLIPFPAVTGNNLKFAEYPEGKLPILSTDVIAPPPEQSHS